MKIIKEGRKPELDTFRMNCSHCGAIFEIMRLEGRVVHDQRDGDYIEHACPTCSRNCSASIGARPSYYEDH